MTEFREIGGQKLGDTQLEDAASGDGATHGAEPKTSVPIAALIDELKARQRERKFCIVQQSRADRSTEAYIVGLLGYRPDLPKADRTKLFKRASALRKKVEKGGRKGHKFPGIQFAGAHPAAAPIILASAQGRASFDALRRQSEKRMRELAKLLPVYSWVKAIKGMEKGLPLAVIVAEAGDLSSYANPGKLWKRLGLAVINGERQRKKTNVEEAAAHGYNPKRRASIYGDVGSPLFFAKAKNAYGEIYAARRAHTAITHPDWTKGHSDNDARRYITKRLLKHLWQAWRAARSRQATDKAVPPAEISEEAA